MKQLLVCTAAATITIFSGHVAHAAQNFTQALSEPILPAFCTDGCDTSSCKCMEEAFGNPALCASEIDSSCKTDGFRGCLPEDQLSSTQNIYCRFSSCIVGGGMSEESCS
eukprot:scaffold27091_cov67-Skeletonema_dohrnii-CCMP3373.AAC.1